MKKLRPTLDPHPLDPSGFNKKAKLPYGCTVGDVRKSMQDFLNFLGFINAQLEGNRLERLEDFLMPANFSSIVGEFMCASIPKHCSSLVKNQYHNGHPDLIPKAIFPKDAVLHDSKGIEVKASRYPKGWQGHNAENGWLLMFTFNSSGARDGHLGVARRSFAFSKVYAAELASDDWTFAGRSATSRRTITASINKQGFEKLSKNWIYRGKSSTKA